MYTSSDIKKKFSTSHIPIEQDKALAPYTTLKIGGKARYFVSAKTENQLYKIISICKQINLPFLLIGKGSNLLISDKGYTGLAILNAADQWQILPESYIPKSVSTYKQISGRVDKQLFENPALAYSDDEAEDVFVRVESGARVQSLIKKLFNSQITGLQWFSGIPAAPGLRP